VVALVAFVVAELDEGRKAHPVLSGRRYGGRGADNSWPRSSWHLAVLDVACQVGAVHSLDRVIEVPCSMWRSQRVAPASVNASTKPAPIPLAPPITTATFPWKSSTAPTLRPTELGGHRLL
jgi:hypothetical protein